MKTEQCNSVGWKNSREIVSATRLGLALLCLLLLTAFPRIARADDALGEALDCPGLEWSTTSTAGNANWFSQTATTHDGVDAARSGAISHNQSSDLIAENVQGPLRVSFWWRVSSEINGDYLSFFVDDVAQFSISGEVGWTQHTVGLSSGAHNLRWTYCKDDSTVGGADAGWVDQVTTETALIVASFAINDGADTTTSRVIILNNACTGEPVEYMASESILFADATWQPYSSTPSFTLSGCNCNKTVYLKVRNALGLESLATSDTIAFDRDIELGEAVEATDLVWSTTGNAGWFTQITVTHDGADAAQTGVLGTNQSSNLIATNVQGPVDVSFWWKVSSEANYDFLSFYVDNVLESRISDEVGWTHHQVIGLSPGPHTLRWTYSKDGGVDRGADAGWLDQVAIGTAPVVTSFAINDDATTALSPVVALNNACTSDSVEYTASETSYFYGAVWQPYSSAPSFALSVTGGTKTVYFKVRNATGLESLVTSDTIQPQAPVVTSFAINDGATTATSPVVTLNNACTGDPIEYMASESSHFHGAVWMPYSSAPSFTLSLSGDAKRVYLTVRNASGFESLVSSDTILPQAPVVTSFTINGGAYTTTNKVVTLNNICTGDPIEYMAFDTYYTSETWLPYSSAPSFTLTLGANNEVYFKVRNAAGFESQFMRKTIALLRPGVTSFRINNGAAMAMSRVVTLNNVCTLSPFQYMASESSSFSGATWQPYWSAPSFTLSSGNDSAKTVYFKVRNAGCESASVSDTILPEPSVVSSFLINDGAITATSRVVTLNNACTLDPVEYIASESSSFSGSSWQPYSSAPIFPLSPGDGVKTVYFKVRSPAGSESPASSDTITLNDMSPPQTQTQHLQRCGLGVLNCAAYSPDGKCVATGGGIGVVLWNAETGNQMRILSAPGHYALSVAFSPDGTKVLTGGRDDCTAKLWDVATGAEIRTFSWYTSSDPSSDKPWVRSVAFSPDGTKILTGCAQFWTGSRYEAVAKLWDAATGDVLATCSGTLSFSSVAFSPDGIKFLTGSADKTAKLWDAATGNVIQTFSGHTSYVTSVVFSPDGTKVLTGSEDRTARLWDVATGDVLTTFTGHIEQVNSVAFSPDGTKVLTGSGNSGGWGHDYTARLWDAATGIEIRSFSGYFDSVVSVAFSPDGTKVLTASYDQTAKLWDVATGAMRTMFSGHSYLVISMAFSPDGTKALKGGDKIPKIWDTATGAVIRAFSEQPEQVAHVAFSPDGTKILTGRNGDGTAKLWDCATGALIRTFLGHASGIESVAFSPDGTKVLTSGNEGNKYYAKLWDMATGALLRTFLGSAYGTPIAFSPDGMKILTGTGGYMGGGAKLYDSATGAVIRTFSGHANSVDSVAFSPDGTKILTGSVDMTAKLWNAETGAVIHTFLGHTAVVRSVAFSPDGTKVMTGGYDGTARIWELSPPRAIIVAGGGDYAGNPIADQTNDLAAYAYKTLKRRGYEAEDILYLTAFPTAPSGSVPPGESAPWRDADGDGLNDVDGWATEANLRDAITGDFGQSAGRLLILMIDHGARTQNFMTFRANEAQVLLSTTLDGWLDDLQTPTANTSGTRQWIAPEVTLVVDSCYSGQMVDDCRLTTTELTGGAGWHGSAGHDPATLAGKKRIVIASTTRDKEAVFLPAPDLTSFMYSFLSSAYMGNSMGEAWRAGSRFFNEFPVADQVPQLSDGTTTSTPGAVSTERADREFFGATWAYGVQSTQDVNDFFPAFEEWTTHTLASPGDAVTLRVKMFFGQNPLQVVAVVRPPAPEVVSGDPVTNLPHFYLKRQSDETTSPLYRVWEVTTNTLFSAKGDYAISFTARFEYERVSNPVYGHVVISEGLDPDQTPIRAILAVDDTANLALAACLEHLGPYAYSVYLDRFKDPDGYSRPDWIEYLINPWWDSDNSGWPSASAVLSAVTALPSVPVGRVYVHLIGETGSESASVSLASGDTLTAAALDAALDALQSRPGEDWTVVLVVDAPGSGAFLPVCRATGGQKRAIFTSGRETDAAYFLTWPTLTCFSQKFLGAAYQGNDLKTAFQSGDTFFNQFLRYFLNGGRIKPQMDDNGDGLYSAAEDGGLAKTLYLGRRYAFAGAEGAGLPFILEASTTQTVPLGGMPASYTVRLIEGIEPTRVFAQMTGCDDAGGTQAVSSVSEVEFTRDAPTSWTWSGAFTAPFTSGSYSVTFYAAYPDTPSDKLSEPAFSGLAVQQTLASAPDIYDLAPYNDDESSTTRNTLSPDIAQAHTIHAVGNMDWLKCVTISDARTPFSLAFATMTLPAGSNLVVKIYEDGPDETETDEMTIGASGGEFSWLSLGLGAETVFFSVEAQGTISPEFRYFVTFERNTGPNNGLASALGSDAMQVEWDNSAPPALGDGFYIQQSLPNQMSGFARINARPIAPQPGRMKVAVSGLQPLTLYFYQIERVSGGVSEMWTSIFYGMTDASEPLSLPGVAFADAASTVSEGATTATISLALSRAAEWIVMVDYAATSGTATGGGMDYALTSGTLIFAPGQTSATIEVSINDNALYEPEETVVIALSLPQGAALAEPSLHTLTIVDNDPPPIITYTLTYNTGANGSISGATSQTVIQGASGTTVTAVPNTGYHFIQWSDGVLTASRADANVTTNITVTANFGINQYALIYAAGANGSISGATTQTVNYGASGTTVTAIPNTGYHFVQWNDGLLTASRMDTNVTTNIRVTAIFTINTCTLTIIAEHGSVAKSPDLAAYDFGATVTLTAVADAGFLFVGWTGDVAPGHELDNPLDIVMDADKALTAVFERATGTVVVQVIPSSATWSFADGDGRVTTGTGDAITTGVPTGVIELTWNALAGYTTPSPNPTTASLAMDSVTTFTAAYALIPAPTLTPHPSPTLHPSPTPTLHSTPTPTPHLTHTPTPRMSPTPIASATPTPGLRMIAGWVQTRWGDPISSTAVSIADQLSSATSGVNGGYAFSIPMAYSGSMSPSKSGYVFSPPSRWINPSTSDLMDVNFTGALKPQRLKEHLIGIAPLPPEDQRAGDVNRDGVIDMGDLVALTARSTETLILKQPAPVSRKK
ncbi:MAG: InlB B-repeat-containing protein [Candidatus Sumerlaeota bacterium]|nr:InlB B-repeat-containing protein [Candidatus Sumerlaeota bacterium]